MLLSVFFKDARLVFKRDSLTLEILQIGFPAALALAADPVASLIDTAFVGHLGSVELAAVGLSIAIFNVASKVTIYPLISVTTSFVAEEDTVEKLSRKVKRENLEKNSIKNYEMEELLPDSPLMEKLEEYSTTKDYKSKRRQIPSASTALIIAAVLGLLQTIFFILLAEPILRIMGVNSDSPMLAPAKRYLAVRSLGAPAVLISLAVQGVFRGFKDTTTPLYATVVGDVTNIILDRILIFKCNLGVNGAAIAHVFSQYLMSLILLWALIKQVDFLPPSIKDLQFSRFLKNGFLLFSKVIATTSCVTLAASMAARLGPTPMAGFQVCLQVWMMSSLLADGLAVAAQAILACAFTEKDYEKATAAASRALQMGFVLGLVLTVVVGLGLHFGSWIFSEDKDVIRLISLGIPFVAATQPINTLSFVFDGVNYGASDFAYSAYSMILVSILSSGFLTILSSTNGFVGIWIALTIYMCLRTFAGVWRMGTAAGPWSFLRSPLLP